MRDHRIALLVHASIPVGLLVGVVPVVVAPVAALLLAYLMGGPVAQQHAQAMIRYLGRVLLALGAVGALILVVGEHLPVIAAISAMTTLVAAGLYFLIGVPVVAVMTLLRGEVWRYPMTVREVTVPRAVGA